MDHQGGEVSDVDSSDSLDIEDINYIIHGENEDIDVTNCMSESTVDNIITEDYVDKIDVPQLPEVAGKLANIVTDWMRNVPSREKVRKLFKDCLLPQNVPDLKPVLLNELLYTKLNFTYKLNDQRLRGINTYFARGLGPLVSIWDDILKFESTLCKKTNHLSQEGSTITIEGNKDVSLDMYNLRKKLDKSIRLLTAGHAVVLDKQKNQLKSFFHQKYHYLLKPSNPVTNFLLGDSLDQRVIESNKVFEAAQKLQFRPAVKNYTAHSSFSANNRSTHGSNRFSRSRGRVNSCGRSSFPRNNYNGYNGYSQRAAGCVSKWSRFSGRRGQHDNRYKRNGRQ